MTGKLLPVVAILGGLYVLQIVLKRDRRARELIAATLPIIGQGPVPTPPPVEQSTFPSIIDPFADEIIVG